ncbi:MAG: SPASM domain-containing protein [Candidatus Helarchaeota archaeon]|nr:SPASM domain-containing protein [Candidatus Helarchaeota archaeon]
MGRINQDSLLDIWQNHPRLMAMRNRHNISLASFAFCKDCRYLVFCTGNCPAGAYSYFGTDCHPNPEGCYRQFLTDGGVLPEG